MTITTTAAVNDGHDESPLDLERNAKRTEWQVEAA